MVVFETVVCWLFSNVGRDVLIKTYSFVYLTMQKVRYISEIFLFYFNTGYTSIQILPDD